MGGLRALVVDDEAPARDELAWLLRRDHRIGDVLTAGSGEEALVLLATAEVDVLFLDIRMPGLSGLDVAAALPEDRRPAVIFVTAYDEHAVSAFDLDASDYLLKPVRENRLSEAVRRVAGGHSPALPEPSPDETIAVELGGVTRFIRRADVRYVESHGDYARLYTDTANHLVRVPLAALEQQWQAAGFVRIHRRYLVAVAHVEEVRLDAGRASVRVGGRTLEVSRRHTRELRDTLVRGQRPRRNGEP